MVYSTGKSRNGSASVRTVEVYKARMMEKLQCRTLAEVVRIGMKGELTKRECQ